MKLAYFHCPSADNDDVALGDAKTLGYVPPTCLLGGKVVWEAVREGLDPCTYCNGPRARCGGRQQGDPDFYGPGWRQLLATVEGRAPVDPLQGLRKEG